MDSKLHDVNVAAVSNVVLTDTDIKGLSGFNRFEITATGTPTITVTAIVGNNPNEITLGTAQDSTLIVERAYLKQIKLDNPHATLASDVSVVAIRG